MGNKMDTWEDIGNVIDGIKNVYDTVQQGGETYASIDNGEVRDNYMRICCIEDDIKRIKIKYTILSIVIIIATVCTWIFV